MLSKKNEFRENHLSESRNLFHNVNKFLAETSIFLSLFE